MFSSVLHIAVKPEGKKVGKTSCRLEFLLYLFDNVHIDANMVFKDVCFMGMLQKP